jgi:hypothetical protein
MTMLILTQEHNSVGLDDREVLVRFPKGERGLPLCRAYSFALGPTPPSIQLVSGDAFPDVYLPVGAADQTPSFSVELKSE